jgi:hypothetical protein
MTGRSSDEGNRRGWPMRHSRALRSSSVSTTCGGHVDHGMIVMVKNITFNSMVYNQVRQIFAEG